MTQQEAIKTALRALVETAAEAGEAERKRLGRALTETEAAELAAIVERQFRAALVLSKRGT